MTDAVDLSYNKIAPEEEDVYTKDGTLDYKNNPANKNITGTWKACPYILGNECCERLAYYGMSTNLLLYFKNNLHQHSATASRNLSNWSGTCYITPLIGAFIADAFLGRYWTIAIFSIIYVIGMTLLTLSATVSGLKPTCVSKTPCHATDTQLTVTFLALYIVALGTGGTNCEEESKSSFWKQSNREFLAKKQEKMKNGAYQRKETRTCYRCNEVGHIAWNCAQATKTKQEVSEKLKGKIVEKNEPPTEKFKIFENSTYEVGECSKTRF
ncbi:putative bacterial ABC-type protein transporter [Helianthus annuus]|nr:putative bacterial ABC-type protein transporter [Helianthus annuus]